MSSVTYRLMDFMMRHSGARERHGVTGKEAENLFCAADGSESQTPDVPYRYLERSCQYSEFRIAGQRCFCIFPKNERQKPKQAILYLFGGGFLNSASGRDFKCAAELGRRTGAEVWLYCYPLEPAHTIHKIVASVSEVYAKLLEEYPPDKITFFGLSAGACICLYMMNYIRSERKNLPYPGRLILNSPVVELPPTKAEYIRMRELDGLDAVLPAAYFGPDGLISCMLRKEPEESRYLSRILETDLTGWPPVTLIYGTNEVPYVYAENFIRACRESGVSVTGVRVKGGGHCSILYEPAPEAKQLMKYVSLKGFI